jgi:arsenite methyltransferase
MLAKYIAAQLRRPSGIVGKYILLPFLNRVNALINALAIEQMNLSPQDTVLEVGFGGGGLIARLVRMVEQGKVTGIDFSPEAVALCTKKFAEYIEAGKVALQCADVEDLPFASDTFTRACTVNTIYFWRSPRVVLSQLHRVLKPGGMLVVCFTPKKFMKDKEVMRHGFTLYEPDEVGSLLSEAGFRNVRLVPGKHLKGECVAAVGEK